MSESRASSGNRYTKLVSTGKVLQFGLTGEDARQVLKVFGNAMRKADELDRAAGRPTFEELAKRRLGFRYYLPMWLLRFIPGRRAR